MKGMKEVRLLIDAMDQQFISVLIWEVDKI
jgi:hypothetical protein